MDNNVDDPDRYNSPRLIHGDFVRLIKKWSEQLTLFESYTCNKIAADLHGCFAVYGREIFRRLVIVHKVGKHRSVRPEKSIFLRSRPKPGVRRAAETGG